jgi:hypothetical protein
MLGPLVFSFFTVSHALIAVGALAALDKLPAAAICLFLVEAVTAFDNGVTVAGNRLGIAPRTERLNRMRFLLHAVCIGLLLPVYAAVGNSLAFDGVAAVIIDYGAWALAALIMLYGYFSQYRGVGAIVPVSYYGCLRYAQSVSELTRHPQYNYTADELARKGKMPVASIATTAIGLVIAFFIGWSAGFWVPFVVTALMFLAGGLPLRSWGPFATSCLEIIYSGGMLYALLVAAGAAT